MFKWAAIIPQGNRSRQAISSGDNSTNIQAGSVIISGSDEQKIKSIIELQTRDQLSVLTQEAYDTFRMRCSDFSDGLVHAFSGKYALNSERLKEPGVQFSINAAHKAYGETGEEGLKDTLITIIGKMCSVSDKQLDRLYKDAIDICARLSQEQINTICLMVSGYQIYNTKMGDLESLVDYLRLNFDCLLDFLPQKNISIAHLEYLGLITRNTLQKRSVTKNITSNYAGLFSLGFSRGEIDSIDERVRPPDLRNPLIFEHPFRERFCGFIGLGSILSWLWQGDGSESGLGRGRLRVCGRVA